MQRQISSLNYQRSFITLIILLITAIVVSAWQHITSLDIRSVEQSGLSVDIHSEYFVDKQSALSAEQALVEDYTEMPALDIPFDLGEADYWVKFQLKNRSERDQELVLHIDNVMLNVADIHHIALDGNIDSVASLDLKTPFPHYQLTLPPFASKALLVKLNAFGTPDVPLVWYSQDNYKKLERLARTLFGAAIGVLAIIALYNLVIYAAIKDPVYLVYIGYLLSAFVVLATVNGFGYLLFTPEVQLWFTRNSLFFHYYLVIFILLFALYFLKYNETGGALYKIGIASVFVLIALSVVGQFLPHSLQVQVFFSLPPIFYLYSLALLILKLRSHFSWARFYFLSWISLLTGAAIQPLVLLNYLDYSFLLKNAFLLAVVIEIVLMGFALAERMRRHEIERVNEISYDMNTGIPRKVILEKAVSRLICEGVKSIRVAVIKPEHIDRISLYVNDAMNTELLKQISRKLSPLFAYNDAIEPITFKGEKLALISTTSLGFIINESKNKQPIDTIIESISTLVGEAYQIESLNIPLKALVGIANYPENGHQSFVLVNRAQFALSEAEQSSKRWAYFEQHNSDKTGYRLQLASDINQALRNGEFALYHQPQIDLKTMRVCGSECLMRWNHPDEGFIPPEIFIPIAEDMGLINQLTFWVIGTALAQHKEILGQGYKRHMVSINISGKDITADGFYEFVLEALKESEVPPSRIAFELTESATITDNNTALDVISRLNELGITISIDDFGTGYSSMAYVSTLPLQELKIDRQFVENVGEDEKQQTIAKTMVSMAKGLGLEVVAEGINSQSDEDTMRLFGCDIGQGYFYAKPMAFSDYQEWLKDEINGRSPAPLEGEFIPRSV
ncbi:MAG: EAL domain-containing protein [Thalassotalea sp.]|nr:EAL domain-containing protein [Thalassotalea sp.]